MITTSDVETWLGTSIPASDTAATTALVQAVQAVNITVTQWHGEDWTDRIKLGATMLAAHLWRRRGTPAGVSAFSEEGSSYVQKYDPQASMLLGLSGWERPKVG